MKKGSITYTAALAILAAQGGAAHGKAGPAAQPPSLCAATEEVVFGCAQDGKIISLCAAKPANGQSPVQLRYVSGTKGKVELEISQTGHPEAFTSGETAMSGGGIDYVRVKNGDFAYVVYTGMSPSWSQDGWIVEAHGAPVSHHICKRAATGPDVWSPVYAAKLPRASDDQSFEPPDWVGSAPRHGH